MFFTDLGQTKQIRILNVLLEDSPFSNCNGEGRLDSLRFSCSVFKLTLLLLLLALYQLLLLPPYFFNPSILRFPTFDNLLLYYFDS